ncbi:MAG: translation initiation factor IF-2 N-terminal domain-containing protein, partial [Patescibacteria group bacterium]|nr:translation initiation factor IF-2 N-terminal domain-containing protein [Patescibacteria group bacterium]
MNLSSLSSQLNLSIQELRSRAREKGFFISPKANKVDNYLAKKILESLASQSQAANLPEKDQQPKIIKLPTFIKVRDFAELLKLPVVNVIKVLIKNGVMATINEEV